MDWSVAVAIQDSRGVSISTKALFFYFQQIVLSGLARDQIEGMGHGWLTRLAHRGIANFNVSSADPVTGSIESC